MMRALYSGVSGLKNHQTRMDVIGNNIANVNTVGYKTSRVVFQDLYSQTLNSGTGSTAAVGGSNAMQVGLGASLASIDVLHTRGGTQYTGSQLDFAIEGDGYFILNVNGSEYYTRSGNFKLDDDNNLVNSQGYFVQGYSLDMTATPPVMGTTLGNINIDPSFKNITVDNNGAIWGIDATDTKVQVGQIRMATFSNPSGLVKVGQSMYSEGANSGAAVYGNPGENGGGLLSVSSLEMSNVDLAQEFSDMIVTQRGFQACSRIITTTDQILEELVNMKR
jgi:flagellar hook protein FlgE